LSITIPKTLSLFDRTANSSFSVRLPRPDVIGRSRSCRTFCLVDPMQAYCLRLFPYLQSRQIRRKRSEMPFPLTAKQNQQFERHGQTTASMATAMSLPAPPFRPRDSLFSSRPIRRVASWSAANVARAGERLRGRSGLSAYLQSRARRSALE
jgi:hypothetical protein